MGGRYLTLDAMRGIAAGAVAVYHFRREAAPEAYLAVDFFFALSGFVLTKAYAARLAAGASVVAFMGQRVVRLYPLFLAGIGFGLAWEVARSLHSPAGAEWGKLAGAAAANLLMLPSPFYDALYPFDYAFWSIGAELLVNALFAVVLVRRPLVAGVAVTAAAAVALVVLVRPPLFANGGVDWATVKLAVARTAFSFTLGGLAAQVLRRRAVLPALLVLPVLAVLCAVLFAQPEEAARRVFDLLAILLVLPALLVLGALVEPPAIARRAAALLGDISYPLYAVHAPVAMVAYYLGSKLAVPGAVLLPVYGMTAVGAAVLLERWWDRPARHRLAAWLAVRRSAEPVVL